MSRKLAQIRGLTRIARIKSDIELKRFSAFRRHVAALDARIDALGVELREVADSAADAWTDSGAAPQPDAALRQARLAHAITRQLATERAGAEAERDRLTARLEAARAEAARAFGRAEVLAELARRMDRERTARRDKGP